MRASATNAPRTSLECLLQLDWLSELAAGREIELLVRPCEMIDSPGSNEALQQTRELKRPSKRDQLNLSKRHAPHPIYFGNAAGARPPGRGYMPASPSAAFWRRAIDSLMASPGCGNASVFSQGDLKGRGGPGFFSTVVHYIF